MAGQHFIRAAQLRSARSILDRFPLESMMDLVHRSAEAARLDILIAGGEEIPELYQVLAGRQGRAAPQVFLWYAVLADNPVLQPDDRVVNYRGEPSLGWRSANSAGEPADGGENFIFACPNRPRVREAVLYSLERQLTEYPFDGVFLDKIRFPSPANGLEEVFSCFCSYCRAAAAHEGLDLDEVKTLLERLSSRMRSSTRGVEQQTRATWLENLLCALEQRDLEILVQMLNFRARSITRLGAEIRDLTGRLGVQLALDLFSPGLARLVGQDYPALSGLADWVKPMIYRRAIGPAGLRLEVPQLARGFENFLSLEPGEGERWMGANIPGLAGSRLSDIEQDGVPLPLIASEMERAVEQMGNTPVYMGVEAISIPAFNIDIKPDQLREMIAAAQTSGAQGVVLSWDLLSMPLENLRVAGT